MTLLVIEIELGIIVLAILGLLVAVVPVLTSVKRVSEETERLLRYVNTEMLPLLQTASHLIRTLDGIAADIKTVTAGVAGVGEAIGGIGRSVTDFKTSLYRRIEGFFDGLSANVRGWIAGTRAALRVLKP